MSQVFELASGTEFADVFLSGFGSDVKTLGDGEIGATVEFGWEAIEECLAKNGDGASSGVGVGGWKLTKDVGGVLQQQGFAWECQMIALMKILLLARWLNCLPA